ncbi:pathogenesis-related protein STH-2-like [Curcuma longa]|uniref:pathogenesis-related protein STH-2-like n=1 Tax=Curcuma longa TaxID=136217 RepID=UPI003D9E70D7
MVASSCIDEITLNVSNSRLWKGAVCDAHTLYPKLLPDFFAKGERIGEGVGSITILYFGPGSNMPIGSVNKSKVEKLDEATYSTKYSVIEGPLVGVVFKSVSYESTFEATGPNSCIAKIKTVYETLEDKPPSEEELKGIRDGSIHVIKAIEAYLIANPDVYA